MNKALIAAAAAALGIGMMGCQADEAWHEQQGESEATGTTTEAQELLSPTTAVSQPSLTTATRSTATTEAAAATSCTPRPGINPLDHRLAAIATITLRCGQDFNAKAFAFQQPKPLPSADQPLTVLWPTFRCDIPENPDLAKRLQESLENMLGLQYLEGDRAGALAYFRQQWRGYLVRLRLQKVLDPALCPNWDPSPVNTGDKENPNGEDVPSDELLKELTREKPEGEHAKTHYYWKVSATPAMAQQGCSSNRCVLNRAKLCSSAFGDALWETSFTADSIVKTDPNYWDDNTFYGNPDFFDFGWVHQMATSTGWPPGDLWGAPMRANETCTYYASNMVDVLTGSLSLVNCGGGWMCATECKVKAATTTTSK